MGAEEVHQTHDTSAMKFKRELVYIESWEIISINISKFKIKTDFLIE